MAYETPWTDSVYELDLFEIIRNLLMRSNYKEAALSARKSLDELNQTNWQSIKNGVVKPHSFYFDKPPKHISDTQQDIYMDGYAFIPNIADIFDKYCAGGYPPLMATAFTLHEYNQYLKPIEPIESVLNPPYMKDIQFENQRIKSIEIIIPYVKNWKREINKTSNNKYF